MWSGCALNSVHRHVANLACVFLGCADGPCLDGLASDAAEIKNVIVRSNDQPFPPLGSSSPQGLFAVPFPPPPPPPDPPLRKSPKSSRYGGGSPPPPPPPS